MNDNAVICETPLGLTEADVKSIENLEDKLQLIRDRVSGVANKYQTGCYLVGRPGISKTGLPLRFEFRVSPRATVSNIRKRQS